MLIVEFIGWWYGAGWLSAWQNCLSWVKAAQRIFSVDVLIKTMFSPWKRITTTDARSLNDKFRTLVDNLVSRAIGFFVRLFTFIAAMIVMAVAFVAGIAIAVTWPAMPLAVLFFIFKGFLG